MRRAPEISLSVEDRSTLERWSRSRSEAVRLVERARIVLLAAQGLENQEIAEQVGVTRITAGRWRSRFAKSGIAGIEKDRRRLPHRESNAIGAGAVAQFERDLIRERQRDGVALAKGRGVYLGRKKTLTED